MVSTLSALPGRFWQIMRNFEALILLHALLFVPTEGLSIRRFDPLHMLMRSLIYSETWISTINMLDLVFYHHSVYKFLIYKPSIFDYLTEVFHYGLNQNLR